MARLLVLDILNKNSTGLSRLYEAEINEIEEYYKHLGCRCYDVACRQIGNKYYDIFVDDEGLFAEDPKISAIDETGKAMLVGNLIFANHDSDGNTTSLSDSDIENIKEHVHTATFMSGEIRPVVICRY